MQSPGIKFGTNTGVVGGRGVTLPWLLRAQGACAALRGTAGWWPPARPKS